VPARSQAVFFSCRSDPPAFVLLVLGVVDPVEELLHGQLRSATEIEGLVGIELVEDVFARQRDTVLLHRLGEPSTETCRRAGQLLDAR
jgi:hypothetical protein